MYLIVGEQLLAQCIESEVQWLVCLLWGTGRGREERGEKEGRGGREGEKRERRGERRVNVCTVQIKHVAMETA